MMTMRLILAIVTLTINCALLFVIAWQFDTIRRLKRKLTRRQIALRVVASIYVKGKFKSVVWIRQSRVRYQVKECERQKYWLN